MSWANLAISPNIFTTRYSSPPALEKVELIGLSLSTSHGPCAYITLSTTSIPDRPVPARWAKNFNCIMFTLGIYGLQHASVHRWGQIGPVSISVEKRSDDILEILASDDKGALFDLNGTVLQVGNITPMVRST